MTLISRSDWARRFLIGYVLLGIAWVASYSGQLYLLGKYHHGVGYYVYIWTHKR